MRRYGKEYRFCKCLLKLYLYMMFLSCSTEAPLDMGPQVQQISVKMQTTKMGKVFTQK